MKKKKAKYIFYLSKLFFDSRWKRFKCDYNFTIALIYRTNSGIKKNRIKKEKNTRNQRDFSVKFKGAQKK